ncbi:MAG: hypothetical protein ACE5K0_07510 [Candidatus Methanofastidiosia archaeon]
MSSTLKDAIKALKFFDVDKNKKIADKWLGKFKGVLPKDIGSAEYIKKIRGSLYEKV